MTAPSFLPLQSANALGGGVWCGGGFFSQAGRANNPCGDAVQVAAIFCPEGVTCCTASPAFLPLQASKACGGGGQPCEGGCAGVAVGAANVALVHPSSKQIASFFMIFPMSKWSLIWRALKPV